MKHKWKIIFLLGFSMMLIACGGGGGGGSRSGSGDIFLVGPFTTYNSVPANRIIRIDVNGSAN